MRKSTKIRNKKRISPFTLAFQHCTRSPNYCTMQEKSNKRHKGPKGRNKIVTSNIPGLRRSAGEEIGYPLQCSWVSLVAQLVKNPPAMWETWAQSLGWEDPLEKGKATHSSILAWRIPWTV